MNVVHPGLKQNPSCRGDANSNVHEGSINVWWNLFRRVFFFCLLHIPLIDWVFEGIKLQETKKTESENTCTSATRTNWINLPPEW